jgi:hypothetical protein
MDLIRKGIYPDKNLEKAVREVTPLFEAVLAEVSS